MTGNEEDPVGDLIENAAGPVGEGLDQLGIDIRRGPDGSIQIGPDPRDRQREPRPEREPADEPVYDEGEG